MSQGAIMSRKPITKEQALEVKKELADLLENRDEYIGIGVSQESHNSYGVVVRLSKSPSHKKKIPHYIRKVPIKTKIVGEVFFI